VGLVDGADRGRAAGVELVVDPQPAAQALTSPRDRRLRRVPLGAASDYRRSVVGSSDDPTRTADSTLSPPTSPAVERPVAPLQVRERDRYEVLAEHGRGGLGRVSRARDKELGRDVAIKELIKRGQSTEIRFVREALITARLEHPGVVPVHEAGCWDDGTPFYAMKLVSGRPLKELIEERTTMEARLGLLPHVIAVADAIAYAHGRRIIHRDLKPGNVIVGEFGETVVIDWGLAKDLSETDEPALALGSNRAAASNELTATGGVLGTPAYMAPEQARGEPVDERVDVFAIGAMLWELCTRTRVPPDPQHRDRQLRRDGIDPDLATIIGKSLADDPRDRYPNAAALATDLKAFLAGARIAARNYSLFAMVAHWTRRQRRLALSAAAVVTVALVATIWFVRNIAVERDRADASAIEAHAHQRRAEKATDEITLQHAELLLRSDPTAAMATLSGYGGADGVQLGRLRAEAIGRGVASATLKPHSDLVWHLATTANGGVISVGRDRTIKLTRDGKSTPLASNMTTPPAVAYARDADVLTYAPVPSGIVVLSLATGATARVETPTPSASDILPDGSQLAAVAGGGVTVWSLGPSPSVIYRAAVPAARDVNLAARDRLVVMEAAGLRAIWLDGSRPPRTVALPVQSFHAVASRIAAGDTDGGIALFSPELAPLAKLSVCRRPVAVTLVPKSDLIGFACEEGVAGVVRYSSASGKLVIVDTFTTTERAYDVVADATGTRIIVSDDSRVFYVYDLETRLVTRYEGQAAQVSAIAAPAPGFDHIAVGDFNGNVRLWDPPRRDARRLFQGPGAVFGVAFSPDGKSVATNNIDGTVRVIGIADGAVTELKGHVTGVLRVPQFSRDGQSVLSYSGDGTARVWRVDGTPLRVFADHARPVQAAAFVESGRRVVSIGDDGRLLAWSAGGTDAAVLHTRAVPLTGLDVLSGSGEVVVRDADSAVWAVALDGTVRQVRTADGAIVAVLRASPDGRMVATATDVGDVVVYDTSDWRTVRAVKLGRGVRQIRFDPKNRDLIVALQDGRVHAVALGSARTARFAEIANLARNLEYSPDGEVLAIVCTNGGTWFYDLAGDTWAYAVDHTSEVFSGAFSPDGALFASGDRRGLVTIRNVAATLAAARRP
jgi:WD40 repeat protein/tRNA A-37 threonylcarbamoyl transferase component Bud32